MSTDRQTDGGRGPDWDRGQWPRLPHLWELTSAPGGRKQDLNKWAHHENSHFPLQCPERGLAQGGDQGNGDPWCWVHAEPNFWVPPPTRVLQVRDWWDPHFIGEEVEAQRGQGTYSRSHSQQAQKQA